MNKEHNYSLKVKWTGNKGEGTLNYRSYERSHTISAKNKNEILASADPAFLGDATKYNPEELLLASISSCHMLWFLHFCADNGIIVLDYIDEPIGTMKVSENGSGQFSTVMLNPVVTTKNKVEPDKIEKLHQKANDYCFIANSLNFKVNHNSTVKTFDEIDLIEK